MQGRRSFRSEDYDRRKDSDFIEKLGKATLHELKSLLRNNSHKNALRWKRVAIRRAIAKLEPHPIEWVLGLDELEREKDRMPWWKRQVFEETLEKINPDKDE